MRRNLAISFVALAMSFSCISAAAATQTRVNVSVRLVDALSTASSQVGDSFSATLASPLIMDGHIVAQEGMLVTGRVREVVSSGRLKRPALILLSLDAVHAPSARYPMQTGDLAIKADSHGKSTLLIIGGLMGTGAALGGAAGGGKGALIGAAAGAGTGTAVAYLTGQREISLPAETLLTFHVNSVSISPRELSRLQRSEYPVSSGVAQHYTGTQSVVVVRRDHDDDDDQGEDEQHEPEHYRAEYPQTSKWCSFGTTMRGW